MLLVMSLLLSIVMFTMASGSEHILKPGEIAIVEEDKGIPITHPLQVYPMDVVMIIDQSGTMSGVGDIPATDPYEWRVEAARYLTGNLKTKQFEDKIPKIGVVNFGTYALPENSIPLTPLDIEENVNQIMGSLQALNLGWTNFGAAFIESGRLFEQARTFEEGRRAAVVLFTDGEPIDERRLSAEEYFREISAIVETTFRAKEIDLFIVGIDATDMTWSPHMESWQRLLPTETSRVFHLESMDELSRVYNDIVRILYEIPDVPPDLIIDAQRLEFNLPAYLEWVEFHVFPETDDIVLNIVRPDGTVVSARDEDVSVYDFETFSIIVVYSPAPGRWQYWIEGGRGQVEVYRNMIPVRLRLVNPRPIEPLGREQNIVAEFFRQDGTPLLAHPDFPIQVEMTITDPAGGQERILLTQAEPGIYTTTSLFIPEMDGIYSIELEVFTAGAFSYTSEYTVEVASLPYLAVIRPSYNYTIYVGDELVVEAEILVAGKPADLSEHFETSPRALVIAWLEPEGVERSPAHYLHPTGEKGRLATVLPYPLPEGSGQVRFRIVGTLFNGENYQPDDLIVSYTAVVRGLHPGFIALIVLSAITLIGSGFGVISYSRRPSWVGRLIIRDTQNPDNETEIALNRFGKKKIITLGKGAAIPLNDEQNPHLRGKLQLERRLTEEGMSYFPVLSYKLKKSEAYLKENFTYDEDLVVIGSYTITYFTF